MRFDFKLVNPETLEPVKEDEEGDVALFINMDFHCSWSIHGLPDLNDDKAGWLNRFMSEAFEAGQTARSKEIMEEFHKLFGSSLIIEVKNG